LEATLNFVARDVEYREVYGITFSQKPKTVMIEKEHMTDVVTAKKDLTEAVICDLILASICIKSTQSNSAGFAKDGTV
jgi:phosphoribosylaminoimidazolecarboxamide formyltransferase/IMP cyclohydrolase